ncbi:hypothetical protein AWB78_06502 [Caballeronia calidae]|uniref:Uncharacterized protein n=1 Tax=Caballeronia calidae TaxID=1777139 RepID=A0A158E866_9BURK|nr:hypothetical protein [Caballeronia calidae]SAL03081.1 hypothetical protein AWB78_06502 [Caballeronia calidae]
MNDMPVSVETTPRFFTIEHREEVVPTECFGPVTIREVSAKQIQAIHAEYAENKDEQKFGYLLLCATAFGPHGERFSMDVFEDMPVRAFDDVRRLIEVAVKINGKASEVEKA